MIKKQVLSGLLIIFILFSIFATPTPSSAAVCKYAKTTVNIRANPNTKSKIVGQVYWNDKVKVIRKVNKEWSLIYYKNKQRYICSQYLRNKKVGYKAYNPPSSSTYKSFEDVDCITNNEKLPQGKLKSEYHLDYRSGVWMIGNRYCIAVGSYYTKEIGVKIDLVLSLAMGRKHILKCITADSKSDKDTTNNHRVHKKDGSVVEFIVKTRYLPTKAKLMGDISYSRKKIKGKIAKIRVYKED